AHDRTSHRCVWCSSCPDSGARSSQDPSQNGGTSGGGERLPSLMEVSFGLGDGVAQVFFAADVVPVEDGACAVAADRHRDGFWYTGAHHVAYGGAAKIVEEFVWHAGGVAGVWEESEPVQRPIRWVVEVAQASMCSACPTTSMLVWRPRITAMRPASWVIACTLSPSIPISTGS